MQCLWRRPHVCKACLNQPRPSFPRTGQLHSAARRLENPSSTGPSSAAAAVDGSRPLRVAVVGSGPAGFYASARLLQKHSDTRVDMYEKLPVPYGLVRFGVAPDHPEVKNCRDKFDEVASSPNFAFVGNVDVGRDVPLSALARHYDALVLAYGASEDRTLDIPGESLAGVLSARAFVGWYNGQPEHAALDPGLDRGEDAVIVGQGNVALDVARILLSPPAALRATDIAGPALAALERSRVRRVRVVGRRGPLQAAFTVKEARELMRLPGVAFAPIPAEHLPPAGARLPRVQRRVMEVLARGSAAEPAAADGRSWALDFFLAPRSFAGTAAGGLSAAVFARTAFAADADPLSPAARVRPSETPAPTTLPAALAFRSIGYRSAPLPGLAADLGVPFDAGLGIVPNDAVGRVLAPAGGPGPLGARHVPGVYCAGWVKRGPTGVIAGTMEDAFATADAVLADWRGRAKFLGDGEEGLGGKRGWEGLRGEVGGLRRVSWEDWRRIDRAERERGREKGKVTEKFRSVREMLEVLG